MMIGDHHLVPEHFCFIWILFWMLCWIWWPPCHNNIILNIEYYFEYIHIWPPPCPRATPSPKPQAAVQCQGRWLHWGLWWWTHFLMIFVLILWSVITLGDYGICNCNEFLKSFAQQRARTSNLVIFLLIWNVRKSQTWLTKGSLDSR